MMPTNKCRPGPEPRVARTRGELAEALRTVRAADSRSPERGRSADPPLAGQGPTVALVPTMGALHDGHLALVRRARALADAVVVSIFVNPLQFGPGEDFERYPRAFDTDFAACRDQGVAVVFAPSFEVMYPQEPVVRVSAGSMGERLEGRHRPGHFDGVLTVVLKLFQLVRPDLAVFGEKDAQQLALVRRMVRDLDLGVEVGAAATVRDSDGLAISSRNAYLSDRQRATALALSRALRAGAQRAAGDPESVRRAALGELSGERGVRLDYLALVDPETFTEVASDYRGHAVLAVAGRVGEVRLIDNTPVTLAPSVPAAAGGPEG